MTFKSGKKNFFCDCEKWQTLAEKEYSSIQQTQNKLAVTSAPVKAKKFKGFNYKRKKANYTKTKGKQKKKIDKIMKCFKW